MKWESQMQFALVFRSLKPMLMIMFSRKTSKRLNTCFNSPSSYHSLSPKREMLRSQKVFRETKPVFSSLGSFSFPWLSEREVSLRDSESFSSAKVISRIKISLTEWTLEMNYFDNSTWTSWYPDAVTSHLFFSLLCCSYFSLLKGRMQQSASALPVFIWILASHCSCHWNMGWA